MGGDAGVWLDNGDERGDWRVGMKGGGSHKCASQ